MRTVNIVGIIIYNNINCSSFHSLFSLTNEHEQRPNFELVFDSLIESNIFLHSIISLAWLFYQETRYSNAKYSKNYPVSLKLIELITKFNFEQYLSNINIKIDCVRAI